MKIITCENKLRGRGAQSVTVNSIGCGFHPLLRKLNIYLYLYFHFFALVSRQSAALIFATQHAMLPELCRQWGTECLYIRFRMPTLLCARHSVKLSQNQRFDFRFKASHGAGTQVSG